MMGFMGFLLLLVIGVFTMLFVVTLFLLAHKYIFSPLWKRLGVE